MASSLFILGGARSGKSRFAVASQRPRSRLTFVATGQACDADMAARIARHQAERPPQWTTVEAPLELVPQLRQLIGVADCVVVDCLTLWVANLMSRGDANEAILKEADGLGALVAGGHFDLTLVSNEVGAGVHPATTDGLRFRDLLGLVNQGVAAACDRVVVMVAGLPLEIKAPQATPHDLVDAP